MNKKYIIIIIIAVLSVISISGLIFYISPHGNKAADATSGITTSPSISGDDNTDKDYTYIPPVIKDVTPEPASIVPTPTQEPEVPFVPATKMDLDPSSITVFVNKEFALPKGYKPEKLVMPNVYFDLTYYDERTLMRPEAAQALEQLFAAAQSAGYQLSGVSAYRSYNRQYNIFINNILTKGKDHTLKYSAVPGTSEHQTGLSIDVSCKSLNYDLSPNFSETPEGIWLAKNAYLYGYIIRYPKGKGKITGYAYEPWHIRYVGKGLAKYLYENDLTLEEYYKYKPSKDFDFEAMYADLINITPSIMPSISPFPTLGPGQIYGEDGEIIDIGPGDLTPTVEPTDIPVTVAPTPKSSPVPTVSVTVTPTDGASSGNQEDLTVTPTP